MARTEGQGLFHEAFLQGRVSFALAVVMALMIVGAGGASAQQYPNRPIRVMTGEVGGGNDFTARLIAHELSDSLGQQVIVENRPTTLLPQDVAKAAPDGYTLLCISDHLWVGPLLETMPYDAVRDFAPVSAIGINPLLLVVNPSLPVNSVKELIDYAKARPGQLNYASGAVGTPNHMASELFKSMAGGLNIVRVPYKSGTFGVTAVAGGEAQMMIITFNASMPFVNAGKLRALAVTSAEPTPLAPGMATISASGLPGYENVDMAGIFAPAKTPAAIVNRLNEEIVRILSKPDIKEKLAKSGTEIVTASPNEFAAAIKKDIGVKAKLIKDAGIKL